jgi:hypothetical protein|tara:strand:+ start:1108 stop:3405 length:2298 start_codon:yes stop_codon:yes gene_type:complete
MRITFSIKSAATAAAILILLTSTKAFAQTPGLDLGRTAPEAEGIVNLPKLSGPITLDGLSDELAWQDIPTLPLTMYEPSFRGKTDRTVELLIAYDSEAVYIAGRFYHEDLNRIRGFSLTRDRWGGDDGFGIMLDTFNDNENAVNFIGLSLGTRMDHSLSAGGVATSGRTQGTGGMRNTNWNSFWDYQSTTTEDGWFGEIRVPFSTLRFEEEEDGSITMGLMGYVSEQGSSYRWTYPAIPQDFPYTQMTRWQKVRLEGVRAQNPVYVAPYVLTGRSKAAYQGDTGGPWSSRTNTSREIGGDLKLTPTSNLTLDLSVNTDFAAVEADQQQVNLTRFSLFFEEKRPFFQERSGVFNFATGADRGTLFYSRRVGLSDGQPVPLFGGARLVGRLGLWDVGVISMQTRPTENLLSENFGVFRLKRRIVNENSTIGAMGTSRTDRSGKYNVTYGADGLFNLSGDEYITLKWLQTFEENIDSKGINAGRFVFDWTRRRLGGFTYQNAFTWSGPAYNPAVGFEPRSDFIRAQSDWNYQWFPDSDSNIRRTWFGMKSSLWSRNPNESIGSERALETAQLEPFLQIETKTGVTFKLSSKTQFEDVVTDFKLSKDADIPAGSYWFTEAVGEFRASRAWIFKPNLTVSSGRFYDGLKTSIGSSVTWSLDKHLELKGGWEWNHINFKERAQKFQSHLLRLTATGAVNTKLSIDGFVQYNSLSEAMTTNTRIRYNFSEGRDLWLVWNESLNLEREILGVPMLPLQQAQTLTAKYTHTFIF